MRPDVLEKMIAPVPLKRLGLPQEIAQSVLFIFQNDFFTGRCLEIDGACVFRPCRVMQCIKKADAKSFSIKININIIKDI